MMKTLHMKAETTTQQLILGTAGHIDHGKTALVKALTGIDTDRLPQEKQRGITIDLGFAELELGVHRLGIVDVPGHERFIRNMLAGASGINLAMLVVAADDSVMPQTREHLAILQLLGLKHGLIALTKTDLAEPSWVDLVEDELRDLVKTTFLADAPIVRTSAVTRTGLETLKQAIGELCERIEAAEPGDLFRLAVDRSFVMHGRGAVVTGTVWSGQAGVGEELEWLPSGKRIKVRGLQSHGRDAEKVGRGQRAAVNLMNIHHSEIQRGHELATIGYLKPTRWLSVELSVLESCPWPIRHRSRLRLHLGTQEVIATVALLEGTVLKPGQKALAQLFCAKPTVAVAEQPFVVRMVSPLFTIGGGRVLQPLARRIGRRDARTIDRLAQLLNSDPARRAAGAIYFFGARPWSDLDLCRDTGMERQHAADIVTEFASQGILTNLKFSANRSARVHRDVLADLEDRVVRTLKQLHKASPLAATVGRDQLAHRLQHHCDPVLLATTLDHLIDTGRINGSRKEAGGGSGGVAIPDFAPRLSDAQKRLHDQVVDAYAGGGLSPPDPATLAKICATTEAALRPILNLCTAEGHLIHIDAGLYLHKQWEDELRESITKALAARRSMTMAQIRDMLGTTRKFTVPFCEYLDRTGLTHRIGDQRVLADNMKEGT